MTKIAILTTATFLAAASPAFAALSANGGSMNALTANALSANALTANGSSLNGGSINGGSLNGNSVNAIGGDGFSLGGVDGMKVMSIELSR